MAGVFEILRRRWPEAALVVGFHACVTFLMEQVLGQVDPSSEEAVVSEGKLFIVAACTTAFGVIWLMLYMGFLATSYRDGSKPQEPIVLLRTGRHFFWRMVRFQILFAFVYVFLSYLIIGLWVSTGLGSVGIADVPRWFERLCSLIALFILAKPTLLMPASMIVADCRVREAFFFMRRYRLLNGGRKLVLAFFVCLATIFLFSFLPDKVSESGFYHDAAIGVYAVISSSLLLAMNLFALCFVAEQVKVDSKLSGENNGEAGG